MKVPMLYRGDAILFRFTAYIEQEDGLEYSMVSIYRADVVVDKLP